MNFPNPWITLLSFVFIFFNGFISFQASRKIVDIYLENFNSKFFKETVSNGNIIYLVADWTNYDPKITEELEKYKRGGVPLYLYWKKDSKNPRILPAILSKQILKEYTR